jgi:hypothetical protein
MLRLDSHMGGTLYETPSKLFIQPHDEPEEALVINRQTGEISLSQMFSNDFMPSNTRTHPINGIIGIKHLINSSYLIVITSSSYMGSIFGNDVYKVNDTLMIPFKPTRTSNTAEQTKWQTTYLKMLDSVLQTPSFYFSYTYDLTNCLQRNHSIAAALKMDPLAYSREAYNYCDKRFLWNDHLLSDFDRSDFRISRYLITMILGFISINKNALGDGLNWSLISRRSVRRAGTRFNCRGIDRDGNVANFVETEQILEWKHIHSSFVQIRGSIPLFWSQKPGYKYKPRIEIHDENHEAAMEKHINELQTIYGNVSMACLIDQRGHEGNLANEFGQKVNQIQKYYNVQYHYFDFHKECSKMRWNRLSILLERMEEELLAYGFFGLNKDGVFKQQTGIVRSNCIDSLDRTNVIQSMIAQYVLQLQLGAFAEGSIGAVQLADFPIFMDTFKNVWADNADAISIQYAGTPALKTDFTRTGQRTHAGMLKDGLNSLTRYVCNNYLDTYRQDAIDLFLGNYNGYPSPLYRPMELVSYTSTLPLTIVITTLVALFYYFRWNTLE